MSLEAWLTEKAIKAIFDKLEKGPIRISGLEVSGERDLVIWVSQSKTSSKRSSAKG